MTIIIFSKNKPFRLRETLRSACAHLRCNEVGIVVIFEANGAHIACYRKLKRQFPGIVFRKRGEFRETLDQVVKEANDHIMFVAEDTLFFRDLDLDAAVRAMNELRLFCAQVHLCPGLSISALCGSRRQVQPDLIQFGDFMYYSRAKGTYDWNHPWDLTATIYPKGTVQQMLAAFDKLGIGVENPAQLESYGDHLVFNHAPEVAFVGRGILCSRTSCVLLMQAEGINELQLFKEDCQFNEDYFRSLHPRTFRCRELALQPTRDVQPQ